ncbi:AfsR/SARP family transcriptional regulator [Catenuloplanes japonicus]|uniref:AfsR/SARP family transcriptional regulator n=1 Tax=Catenuloplanes japonicus TaxID=33876 RepID=UPI00068E4E9C|nr:AfsR/SARP family transcriptional regulator [Catenuloplanes japonicus]
MVWFFRALGPPVVERDGTVVDLGGPQRVMAFGVLLANANRVVSVGALAESLWGTSPPSSYRVQLQVIVSDLRRRLAGGGDRAQAPIVTRAPGYLLRVPDGSADVDLFRTEVVAARSARAAGDDATVVRLLTDALARWRGPAFDGLSGDEIAPVALALDRARLDATELDVEARLSDGRLDGLTARLVLLTAEHPLHEPFHRQLLEVHGRAGRRGEASAVFTALRRRMRAELGAEPSAALRDLHRRIMSEDPGAAPARPRAWATAYRQLPPDPPGFVGRRGELAAIRAARGAVVVLEGMAGVGKTRLAVHAAHLLAADYPDGQVHVDLGGCSAPKDPADVLALLLGLSGVPGRAIPPTLDARAAVFRDRLAGRRVLFVLDDAAGEEQLRPLLPAGPGCLAIVTSRRSLAVPGARSRAVRPFRRTESIALLAARVGDRRVAGEARAAGRLAARCGDLPLALTLAAERLRRHPLWTIDDLLRRLPDDRTLDGVRAAFASSYRALPPELRRLFVLLSQLPGTDVTADAVAAHGGEDARAVADGLESLLDEHLVEQRAPDSYRLHALVRELLANS